MTGSPPVSNGWRVPPTPLRQVGAMASARLHGSSCPAADVDRRCRQPLGPSASGDLGQCLVEPVKDARGEEGCAPRLIVLPCPFLVGEQDIPLWRDDRVVERLGVAAANV